MLPIEHLALGAFIVFLAFVVRGFSGFGAALVATPLLALFLDFKVTVLAVGVLATISGAQLIPGARRNCARDEIGPLLVGLVLGLWMGIAAFLRFSTPSLRRAFGLFIILVAVRMLCSPPGVAGKRLPRWAGLVAGVAAGITGGMFGASGPPTIFYLYRRLSSPQAIRGTIIVLFLISDSIRLLAYLVTDAITPAVVQASLWFVPASVLGCWIGERLHLRVEETTFRRCVSLLLIGTGIVFAAGR